MAQPSWIGQTLGGRYRIEKLLGQGGMSAVYQATDPNLQRTVAIKIIHPHLSGEPDFVRRFEQEAASVAQLRHSNIIQVYDFNHDGDAYYIVFEYVAGETLQRRLQRLNENGQLMPITEAIDIAASLGEAMNYAHQRGLIHRDIKPANIMLNSSNQPILMDFGIAKMVGGAKHTATGVTLGTAQYMSPEQIKGGGIDNRTDIYALGITLFEMMGGRSPFDADSTMAVMMMHVQNPVPDLRAIRGDVPADLVVILNKALAKEPDGRYQTAAQLTQDIRNARLHLATDDATWSDAAAIPTRARESRTVVEPPGPLPSTQKIERPLNPTIVDSSPLEGQYMPVALPSQPRKKGGGKGKVLIPVLALLVLLLIAGGVWFTFFRGPNVPEMVAAADALVAAGQYDAAITAYEEILDTVEPGNEAAQAGVETAVRLRGEAAFAAGNYTQAKADLQPALQQSPRDAALNLMMGQIYAEEGQPLESLPYYEAALAADPNLHEARLAIGDIQYEEGRYNDALATFTDIVTRQPTNVAGYQGQARSYYALGWYEDALEPLESWADLAPSEVEPYKLLGQAYDNLGMYAEAIPHFQRWAQLSQDAGDKEAAKTELGWAFLQTERYEEAIDTFSELVQTNAELATAYEGLGNAHWALAEKPQALQAYQEWVRLEPDSAVGHAAVGRVARDTGDLALSIESYNQALSFEAQPNWYVGLGQALVSDEQYSEALRAYQQSWELDPEQVDAYRLAGWLYLQRMDDNEAAITAFQEAARNAEAVGLTEADASIYVGLGTGYRALGQHRQAIAPLRTALELTPDSVNAVRLLALSYFNLEDYQNAIVYFSRAIELDERPDFLAGLGQSYRLSGNCEAAIPVFERALLLQPDHSGAADGLQRCQP